MQFINQKIFVRIIFQKKYIFGTVCNAGGWLMLPSQVRLAGVCKAVGSQRCWCGLMQHTDHMTAAAATRTAPLQGTRRIATLTPLT
jgi:hypothetical protein